jgi:hypothetical protein
VVSVGGVRLPSADAVDVAVDVDADVCEVDVSDGACVTAGASSVAGASVGAGGSSDAGGAGAGCAAGSGVGSEGVGVGTGLKQPLIVVNEPEVRADRRPAASTASTATTYVVPHRRSVRVASSQRDRSLKLPSR